MGGWQEKALREAKLRSSWTDPDTTYEARCKALINNVLSPGCELATGLHDFVRETAAAGLANSLVQAALRLTVPGVPDTYQGTELPDYSLVDPDNRRPVNYDLRQRTLGGAEAHPKLRLIARLLAARRDLPELFAGDAYRVVRAEGEQAGRILAFEREEAERCLSCAFALRMGAALAGAEKPALHADYWGDSRIAFSSGTVAASDCFADFPVHVAVDGKALTFG